MKIDIRGRVDNLKLPATRCLRPVFEAIANSIHAIQDRDRGGADGRIDIILRRDMTQGVLTAEQRQTAPVAEFEIRDNGVGFNDANFDSFSTSDSRFKIERGGKGIGRLLWLKAFAKVHVESVFEQEGDRLRRIFTFSYSPEGVSDDKVEPAENAKLGTTVRLLNFKGEYKGKCPKSLDALATRFVEHCLEYLALRACPKLVLTDETTGDSIDLNRFFNESCKAQAEDFEIDGHAFRINHVMVPPRPNEKHSIHYCAHSRAVTSLPLAGAVPNLENSLRDDEEGRRFVYAGYVSGELLNDRVVAERTAFDFAEDETLADDNDLRWSRVQEESIDQSRQFLSKFTEAIRKRKEEQVRDYVERQAPQYRPLLKHKPEAIDQIPPNLSADRLDVELYRLNQEYDGDLRERYHDVLNSSEDLDGFAEHEEHYEQFLEEWNERGVAMLAQHVIHRKATLSFLRKRLEVKDDGKYHKEDAIHEVVFPLRTTSDDIPPERMNLWILDEKLAYHYYLASDKYATSVSAADFDATKRADLLIFNHPFAFAEEDAPRFGSIVLVEFKRPARDDYTDDENPIAQVVEYIEMLRSGKAKDRRGRPLKIPDSLPIHAMIVCDITHRLEKYASRWNFTRTADSQSYFHFHNQYQSFIEIMSFDAMLDKAERRNRILFDKIGVRDAVYAPVTEAAASGEAGEVARVESPSEG